MGEMIAVAQMYTVRQHCTTASDTAETCRKLKDIGFRYVQASGIKEPQDVKELKKIFDDSGLIACTTHRASYKEVVGETDRVIEEHKYLGSESVITGLPHEMFNREGFYRAAGELGSVIGRVNAGGLILGIHNHSGEFERFDGKTGLQILLDNCKGLESELDVYWAQNGGADPVWWIEYFSGRCSQIHFKDMGVKEHKQVMPPIGEGNLNWERIVPACRKAGVKYCIIEMDRPTIDGFEALKVSLENMKKWGISA
jgi:sugar phosphate isomerase/epimerase